MATVYIQALKGTEGVVGAYVRLIPKDVFQAFMGIHYDALTSAYGIVALNIPEGYYFIVVEKEGVGLGWMDNVYLKHNMTVRINLIFRDEYVFTNIYEFCEPVTAWLFDQIVSAIGPVFDEFYNIDLLDVYAKENKVYIKYRYRFGSPLLGALIVALGLALAFLVTFIVGWKVIGPTAVTLPTTAIIVVAAAVTVGSLAYILKR